MRVLRCLPLLALLAAHPAQAEEAPAGAGPAARITAYGETVARRELGVRDPMTVDGQDTMRTLDGVTVVRQTSHIEARLCRRFGIRFVVEPVPDGTAAVTIRSEHPPLRRPDGRVGTGFSYEAEVSARDGGYSGFTFDHPWELVPGVWTFQVLHRGRVLAEQRFDVSLPPDGGLPLSGACDAPIS